MKQQKNKKINEVPEIQTMVRHTNNPWTATIILSVVFIGLFALLLTLIVSTNHTQKFAADCKVGDIVYTDVTEHSAICYGDFSPYYCPLPKNVECSFSGEFNPSIIVNALMDSDNWYR
jgi:hypothetical protein